MMVGEDKYRRKHKKHGFVAAAILLFIGKIIKTQWTPRVVWKLFFFY